MNQTVLRKNETYDAEILSVTGEGFGVCRIEGVVVFVPQTAAGDRCAVKIVKVLSRYAYGIAVGFSRRSPDRVEPDCGVYRQCGGCCFRHLTYEAELAVKEAVVRDAFGRLGGIRAKEEPILPSPRTEGYRNKAQYPVGERDGRMVCGFFANRSHRIIPSDGCALQPPVFSEIAAFTLRALEKEGVRAYDEETGAGELRHLCLRAGEASGEVQLCLVAARDISQKVRPVLPALVGRFPAVKSVVLNLNPKPGNVILGRRNIVLSGSETIRDTLCGKVFSLSPLSFYQVNRAQAERLYAIARDYAALSGGETLVDLYCGVGTIGLSMADRCGKLIGAEIVPAAVENAKENARRNGVTNAEFLCGDAADATETLRARGISPDVVILDPPRKGCGADVIENVAQMAPRKIVMISCNPATAARDCRLFTEKGYRVERYRAVDMFPRTGHCEVVTLITRT